MRKAINVFEAANRPSRKLTSEDKVAINKAGIEMMIAEIEELMARAERFGMDRTVTRLYQARSAARYQLKRI
jgi:DNA polymerase III delta prime subunit